MGSYTIRVTKKGMMFFILFLMRNLCRFMLMDERTLMTTPLNLESG